MPVSALTARHGRAYFAVQALAGALWWACVFTVAPIRHATLGGLPPVPVAALDVPLFVAASVLAACGMRWTAGVVAPWALLVTICLIAYATLTGDAGWGALAMLAASTGTLAASALLLRGRVPMAWIFSGPFRFRLAPEVSPGANLAKTAGQIAVFWGVALGIVPTAIRFVESRWGLRAPLPDAASSVLLVVGAVLFVAASALGLWSAVAMSLRGDGTPLPSVMTRTLITAGPYHRVRNPMAIAGIAQGVAVGLMLGSWMVVGYAIAGSLVWNWIVRPVEEADLEARFGAEFVRYRDRVACWFPRRRRPAQAKA